MAFQSPINNLLYVAFEFLDNSNNIRLSFHFNGQKSESTHFIDLNTKDEELQTLVPALLEEGAKKLSFDVLNPENPLVLFWDKPYVSTYHAESLAFIDNFRFLFDHFVGQLNTYFYKGQLKEIQITKNFGIVYEELLSRIYLNIWSENTDYLLTYVDDLDLNDESENHLEDTTVSGIVTFRDDVNENEANEQDQTNNNTNSNTVVGVYTMSEDTKKIVDNNLRAGAKNVLQRNITTCGNGNTGFCVNYEGAKVDIQNVPDNKVFTVKNFDDMYKVATNINKWEHVLAGMGDEK